MNETVDGLTADPGRGRAGGDREGLRLLRLSAALIVVNGLLLLPDFVLLRGRGAAWVAVEACVLVGIFSYLPRRRATVIGAGVAAASCVAVFVLEIGETATWTALRRPLNLYMDLWLLDSVHHLLVGAVGAVSAVLAELLFAATLIGIGVLVTRLLVPWRGEIRPRVSSRGILVAGVLVTVGFTLDRVERFESRVDAPLVRLVRDQATRVVETRRDRRLFAAELGEVRSGYADTPGLLAGLEGRDVVLAFLESYGVAAVEDPRYAPVLRPRLEDLERRMRAAGLHLASGRLVAPSQGGMSWFAHGSILSGLWLDNQVRYELMLGSGRETLIDDFRHAGYRTVALMPAITMAWPEGVRFGYDEVYARDDIDYAGPPLNWVTMPDQFTWSFLERAIRPRHRERPLFAEIGLISSHAPWTPILPVLDDWGAIGTGEVFAPWAQAGEPPEELWRDTERVQEHYALSVEYAVHTMTSYAERFIDDQTLLIVLGDHQPAPLITGEDASWDVPVHVISGDPALLEPFLEWGFSRGAWPGAGGETLGVDYFREWFIGAFSGAPAGDAARHASGGRSPDG
jgi:hypothetical protein